MPEGFKRSARFDRPPRPSSIPLCGRSGAPVFQSVAPGCPLASEDLFGALARLEAAERDAAEYGPATVEKWAVAACRACIDLEREAGFRRLIPSRAVSSVVPSVDRRKPNPVFGAKNAGVVPNVPVVPVRQGGKAGVPKGAVDGIEIRQRGGRR